MTGMTQVFLIFFQVSPRFPALLILLILLVPRASQDFPRCPISLASLLMMTMSP